MVDNIGNILEDTPEYIKGEPVTPATHHLFDTAEDSIKISWTYTDILHHFVAQLLYLLN